MMKKIFLIIVLFCAVMTVSSQVVEPETVLPEVPIHTDSISICYGETYEWQGKSYTESSVDTIILPDQNGCDSVVSLHLTVLPEVPIHTDSISICYGETYEWQGKSYTESAVDTIRLQDLNGCDSVVTLHLTVLPEVPIYTNSITLCYGDTCIWQDKAYTTSCVDTVVLSNMNGCDSVVTLYLTVLPEVPLTEIYDTICSGDTYELNGNIYSVTGDYRMTLENVNRCDSAVLLHLTVLTIEPTYITDTICFGDPYMWKDSVQYFARDTFDVDTVESVGFACDSVVYLQLTVLPISELTIDTTIIEGETFMWQGVDSLYAEHGTCVYVDTLVNALGCDSILTLNLHVLENNVIVHNLDIVEMCADDSVVQMMIEWEGYIDSLGLYFVRDTLDSIEIGLRDTIVAIPADGNLSIPYNYVRAGVHEMQVVGYFRREVMFEESAILTVLYPSSVLEQRWDDVICVLTSGYNGGYDFTAFQWYKDGSLLTGETGYYLNQKLEKGAEYSVLLTDQSGTQLMTCPIRIGYEEPDIRVEPTLVHKRQPVRCQVAEVANMWVYDTMGKLQISNVLHQGRNDVQLPQQSGMYMLKVVLQTGEERTFKVLVL